MIETVRLVVSEQRVLYKLRKSLLEDLAEEECPGLQEEIAAQPQMEQNGKPPFPPQMPTPLGRSSDGHLTPRLNLLLHTSTTSQMVCIRGHLNQYRHPQCPSLGYPSRSHRPSRKICLHQSVCRAKLFLSTLRVRSPKFKRPLHPPRVPAQFRSHRSCTISSSICIQVRRQSLYPRGMAVLRHFPQGRLLLHHLRLLSLITPTRP
jgi:hypothetical protein